MFFKKKKERAQAVVLEYRMDVLEFLDKQMAEAERTEDPGEKILKLQQLLLDAQNEYYKTREPITKRTEGDGTYFRMLGASIVPSMGVMALGMVVFPPLILAGLPAALVGMGASAKRDSRIRKRLEKESRDFEGALGRCQANANKLIYETLENNLEAVARHEDCDKIFEDWSLQAHFAQAVAKQLAEGKSLKAEETADAPKAAKPPQGPRI